MATSYFASKKIKAFFNKLVRMEISFRGVNHVYDIHVDSKTIAINFFQKTQIIVRSCRNHPRHRFYRKICIFHVRAVNNLANHLHCLAPCLVCEIRLIAAVPPCAKSSCDINRTPRAKIVRQPQLLHAIVAYFGAFCRIL